MAGRTVWGDSWEIQPDYHGITVHAWDARNEAQTNLSE